LHSFAQSNVGWFSWIFLVIAAAAVCAAGLGWPRSRRRIETREHGEPGSRVPVQHLILIVIAFSVLWGTLFPILPSGSKGRRSRSVRRSQPGGTSRLGLLLLLLTGIGPLIAWRRASTGNLSGSSSCRAVRCC